MLFLILFIVVLAEVSFASNKCPDTFKEISDSISKINTENRILEMHRRIDEASSDMLEAILAEDSTLINSHHPVDGYTPLIRAARKGEVEKVRILISYGADINLPESKGMRSLAAHKAAFMGHIEVIREIFDSSPPAKLKTMLETQGPKNGKTVLMDALWVDRPKSFPDKMKVSEEQIHTYAEMAEEIVKKSREVDADLKIKDHDDLTALDHSIKNSKIYPAFEKVADLLSKLSAISLPFKGRESILHELSTHHRDLMDYNKKMWTSGDPLGRGKEDKIYSNIENVINKILPQHQAVFFDPGVGVRAEEFARWYKNQKHSFPNFSQLNWKVVRQMFSDDLGYVFRYRALRITEEQAWEILNNGAKSGALRDISKNAKHKSGSLDQFGKQIFEHLGGFTEVSPFVSFAAKEGFAIGTVAGLESLESGQKIYIIKARLPKISIFNARTPLGKSLEDSMEPSSGHKWRTNGTVTNIVSGEKRIVDYEVELDRSGQLKNEDLIIYGVEPHEIVEIGVFEGSASYSKTIFTLY